MCLLCEIKTILEKCQLTQMSDDFSLLTWRGADILSAVEWLMIPLQFSSSLVSSTEFFIQCQFTLICSELTSAQILIESNYSLSHLSEERLGCA